MNRSRIATGLIAGPLFVMISGLMAAGPAQAEDEGIATDRPDFVESSSVVGKGAFQIETSLAHERDKRAGVSTRSTPTLLRWGVSERLELRVETDGFARQSAGGVAQSGFSDVSLGAKWQWREGDEAAGKPALAVLVHADLDSGSAAFRAEGKGASVRVVAEWDLPGDASFGVMPGLANQKDVSGSRFWSGILAATYSRPLTGDWRGFVEVAGRELRSKRYGGNVVTFDTGVTYALSRNAQFDVSVNLGATRNTPNRAIAVGFSQRFN